MRHVTPSMGASPAASVHMDYMCLKASEQCALKTRRKCKAPFRMRASMGLILPL